MPYVTYFKIFKWRSRPKTSLKHIQSYIKCWFHLISWKSLDINNILDDTHECIAVTINIGLLSHDVEETKFSFVFQISVTMRVVLLTHPVFSSSIPKSGNVLRIRLFEIQLCILFLAPQNYSPTSSFCCLIAVNFHRAFVFVRVDLSHPIPSIGNFRAVERFSRNL